MADNCSAAVIITINGCEMVCSKADAEACPHAPWHDGAPAQECRGVSRIA
jgi:hypothetical protein